MDHEEYSWGLPQGCADSRDVTRVGKEESHSQKKNLPKQKKKQNDNTAAQAFRCCEHSSEWLTEVWLDMVPCGWCRHKKRPRDKMSF